MRKVVCILMAVAIAAGVGTTRANEIVINGIDAKISYMNQQNSRESDVGFGLGVGLFNIYGIMGLHYDVLYKTFDYRDYTYDDFTFKGHVRLKYPSGDITPYLGFGWGYRKYWLREGLRWFPPEEGTQSGFFMLGGTEIPVGKRFAGIFEVEYDFVEPYQLLLFSAGVAFRFFK